MSRVQISREALAHVPENFTVPPMGFFPAHFDSPSLPPNNSFLLQSLWRSDSYEEKNYKGKCWHENWKGKQHKQMQQKILCSLCNRGKIPYEPIMPNITYFISHVYSKTQIVLDDCTQIQQWQYTLENEQSIIDQIRF